MPEIISAECPNCLATLKVKGRDTIGKKARCPKCKEPFVIQPKAEDEILEEVSEEEPADDFLNALNSAVKDSSKRRTVRQPKRTQQKEEKKPTRLPDRRTIDDVEHDDDAGMLVGLGAFGWIIGGGIAGLIGAMIWAAIGYSAEAELGFVAWIIGGLVGFGVHQAVPGNNRSVAPGIAAILLTIASVVFGKFLVAWFLFDKWNFADQKEAILEPEAAAIAQLEEDVEEEFINKGRAWKDPDHAGMEHKLPAGTQLYTDKDVHNEAARRWGMMDRDKQKDYMDKAAKEQLENSGPPKIIGVLIMFVWLCIRPMNLLWLFFGGGTAYKVALGIQTGD